VPRISILGPDDELALRRFLPQRIEHSMFLLSNLREAGLEEHEHPRSGSYVGAFESQSLVGVACHYRMGNVIVNAPQHAAAVARAAVRASGRAIAGVVGPEPQVEAIASALGLPMGSAAKLDDAERLYRLALADLQVPSDLREGRVCGRALLQADLDRVTQWMVRYRVETLGEVENAELGDQVRASLEASLARGTAWVLEREGELVAHTGFNAQLPEAVQVGGVWTPHSLRGRGYARCAVASHLLAAREAGATMALLFTGDANVPAQRAYAALGFEAIGRYRLLLLGEPFQPDSLKPDHDRSAMST
jgi:RimJ/RimL family protein N-acetyltransferase